MARSAVLALKIISDASGATKGLEKTATGVEKFQSTMGKLAVPAAAVVAGIAAVGKSAADAASNVEQAFGGIDKVFGKNADAVKAWAGDAATQLGLSKTDYGTFATLIGSQLQGMGVPLDKATDQTKTLIETGADLAATYGGTTADAVAALSAALKGEMDPIEKYGITLKQADINAQKAADGTDKLTGTAGKQATAYAALSLITDKAAIAQGSFAAESTSAAGASQIAAAQAENAKAALGEALLPVVVAVAQAFSGLATWVSENTRVVQILVVVIGGLAAGILAVNTAMKLVAATKAVFTALTGPIGLVVIAVAAVVTGVILLYKKCAWFRAAVDAIWRAIAASATAAWKAIQAVISGVIKVATAVVSAAGKAISATWQAVKAAASAAWNAITGIVRVVAGAIAAIWRAFIGTLTAIWGRISSIASATWNAIKAPIQAVISWVTHAMSTLVQAVAAIWGRLAGLASSAWNAIKSPIQAIVSWIEQTWNALVGAVGAVWNRIASAVSAALEPIKSAIDAIKSAWDATVGAISSTIETVKGWIGGILDKLGGLAKKAADVILPGGTRSASPSLAAVYYPAPTGRGLSAAALGGPTRIGGPAAAPVTVNIYGAFDADNTARQVQAVLTGRSRRVRPINLGGLPL